MSKELPRHGCSLANDLKSSAPCIKYPVFPGRTLETSFSRFVVLSITYFLYGRWAQPSGKWGLESWPIHHAEDFVKPWSNYPNFFAEWSLLFRRIIWKEIEVDQLMFQRFMVNRLNSIVVSIVWNATRITWYVLYCV